MISFLRGNLICIEENRITLDVCGVGYEVFVPSGLIQSLPAPGQEVKIHTHLYVRDECLQLYGFLDPQDRMLFRLLLRTPGIGPRLALTILDTLRGEELLSMISQGNFEGLLRVPGVGRKSAQRLILELKERLPGQLVRKGQEVTASTVPVFEEVSQALLALGYNRQETECILKKIQDRKDKKATVSAPELLRDALRALGKEKG
ncbi:MAG: Holliday junction branch migration protein RuvA [Bacillota bacterium]|nr:Holliday junction branch migration protein RuvA [Bacillota bacterium]